MVRSLSPSRSIVRYSAFALVTIWSLLGGAAQPSNAADFNSLVPYYSPFKGLNTQPDFKHFPFVNTKAQKGGTIRIGRTGTFNSLNFLKYPGRTPDDRFQLPLSFSQYLYDSLLVLNPDDGASYYGLLANNVEVAPNFGWAKFSLRSDARWHDGKPITADDVVFTLNVMKKQGPAFYRQVLRTISATKEGPQTVRFENKRPGNRDFPGIVGTLPIHPKHYWDSHDVSKTTLTPPLASGPYKIAKVESGRTVVLTRVPEYWAVNHPVNIGRYNFNEIVLVYFRDNGSALQAFKAEDFDIRREGDATQWAQGYDGPAKTDGRIKLSTFTADKPGRMVNLVFNLRRPLLKDRNVRKALAMAYDFDQTNFMLYHGLYHKVGSRYGKSQFASKDNAKSKELALLSRHLNHLPKEVINRPNPFIARKPGDRRTVLAQAARLLDEAGLKTKNGQRLDPSTGRPVVLDVCYTNPRHKRPLSLYANNLKALGLTLSYPILEPVSASKKVLEHDYDLAVLNWSPTNIPGQSEFLLWGSKLADKKHSYALSGAKDPVLDALIGAMLGAREMSDLRHATRAFDRVLRWRIYDIPMWRSSDTWIAHWDKFDRPKTLPRIEHSFIDLWWSKVPDLKQSKVENRNKYRAH